MAVRFADGAPVADRIMVRVWELPVRIFHWALVISIGFLTVTGIVIATGNMGLLDEQRFGMDLARAIHVGAGWVFLVAVIGRLIWMFIGNRYAKWTQFIPVEKQRRTDLKHTAQYYSFLRPVPPVMAGHNPLAGLAYAGMFLLFIVQSILGMALTGVDRAGGNISALTSWVFNFLTLGEVRLIHHLIMWAIGVFVIQHLYSMSLVDIEERSGVISSMVTGTKILPTDHDLES